MICHDCGADDKTLPDDGLPVAEVLRLCREHRCDRCLRTPEQVQADFDAEKARNPHQSAHDWDDILKVPNGTELSGSASARSA